MIKVLFFVVGLFSLSIPTIFAQDTPYVVVQSDTQIDIYNLDGLRIMRIEPTQGRIVHRHYQGNRLLNEQVEYRKLPPLPWFFTQEGTFFAFDTPENLRYYYAFDHHDDHRVAFDAASVLQVIDDKNLLVHNMHNQLVIWRRTFNQENLLNLSSIGVESAQYLADLTAIAYVVEDRFDYYTNPAIGSVATMRYHQLIVRGSSTSQPIFELEGDALRFDALTQRLYFFKDKVLKYWDLSTKAVHTTSFNFSYIPSTVAHTWQQPAILTLPNNKYLIWARINARQTQDQLALYDGQTGDLLHTWLYSSPQGTLSLIKELPR